MSFSRQNGMSHLFLVRVRAEDTREHRQPESKRWCGRVHSVVNGEAYEFCGWAELIRCLREMLDDDPQAGNDTEE